MQEKDGERKNKKTRELRPQFRDIVLFFKILHVARNCFERDPGRTSSTIEDESRRARWRLKLRTKRVKKKNVKKKQKKKRGTRK